MVQQKEPWNYVTQNKNYIIISIGNCGIFVSCYCSFYNQNCMSISEHYLVGHPEEIASNDNYYGHTFTHSLVRKMDKSSSSLMFNEGAYHVLYQRQFPDAIVSENTNRIAVRSYQCVNKNKSGKSRL